MACPAASYLPQWDIDHWRYPWQFGQPEKQEVPDVTPPIDNTEAADWGTMLHMAKSLNPDTPDLFPWLASMHDVRGTFWPADMGNHEVCLAYDCESGDVELGPINASKETVDAWRNSHGISWVTGAADWVGRLLSGARHIDDMKTGWKLEEIEWPPMLFYSMCDAKLHPDEKEHWLSISHWPRKQAPDASDMNRYWLQLGPNTLIAFETDLVDAYERTRRAKSLPLLDKVHKGAYCQYCPSRYVCPTQQVDYKE